MTPTMKMYGKHRFPGKLFIVEGIDGSGKSTQIALLQKWLESEGYVTFFSEWNSSPLVREVTRRGKKKQMLTPMTFSLIHATDFADRTEHHIIPPLKSGALVLAAMWREASTPTGFGACISLQSNRHWDSTFEFHSTKP
jgi:dTMP kinase